MFEYVLRSHIGILLHQPCPQAPLPHFFRMCRRGAWERSHYCISLHFNLIPDHSCRRHRLRRCTRCGACCDASPWCSPVGCGRSHSSGCPCYSSCTCRRPSPLVHQSGTCSHPLRETRCGASVCCTYMYLFHYAP